MSSSTSSSELPAAWRGFIRLAVGTTAAAVLLLYAFIVLVDPWGSLPMGLPLDRTPVTSNQRFSYPVLARSPLFDSAVFGTSTSRLLRPADLNPAFGAHFANLAMNSATPYESSRLLAVFMRAHPAAKVLLLGLDAPWCVTGNDFPELTSRSFPDWMYSDGRWRGFAEMFNLFAVQEAAKEFGVLTGIKKPDMGRDGYTRFVPPDSGYDPVRVAKRMQDALPSVPGGARTGPPGLWRFPALDLLSADLAALPAGSSKILLFQPYNYRLFPAEGSVGASVWRECKRRVTALAATVSNVMILDFMLPSPVTSVDNNYWDPLHYRVGVAERIVNDLKAVRRGESSPDARLLAGGRQP